MTVESREGIEGGLRCTYFDHGRINSALRASFGHFLRLLQIKAKIR